MKHSIIIILIVLLITQMPFFVGVRDLNETIIDFLLAIFVYLPLGICLNRRLKK